MNFFHSNKCPFPENGDYIAIKNNWINIFLFLHNNNYIRNHTSLLQESTHRNNLIMTEMLFNLGYESDENIILNAVSKKSIEMFKLILEHSDNFSNDIYDSIIENNQFEMLKMFHTKTKKRISNKLLTNAVMHNCHPDIINYLIDNNGLWTSEMFDYLTPNNIKMYLPCYKHYVSTKNIKWSSVIITLVLKMNDEIGIDYILSNTNEFNNDIEILLIYKHNLPILKVVEKYHQFSAEFLTDLYLNRYMESLNYLVDKKYNISSSLILSFMKKNVEESYILYVLNNCKLIDKIPYLIDLAKEKKYYKLWAKYQLL